MSQFTVRGKILDTVKGIFRLLWIFYCMWSIFRVFFIECGLGFGCFNNETRGWGGDLREAFLL